MCMLSTVAVGSVNPVDDDDDDDFDDDGDDDVGDDGVEIENGKFVTILPPRPDAAI